MLRWFGEGQDATRAAIDLQTHRRIADEQGLKNTQDRIRVSGCDRMRHELVHFDTGYCHSPSPEENEGKLVMIIASDRFMKIRPLEEVFLSAINNAREKIYTTYGYFLPTPRIHEALLAAAERGVDIRLILPDKLDMSYTKYAFRHVYTDYLSRGIRIFEYQDSKGNRQQPTAAAAFEFLFIHQTHHRGQISQILDTMGIANNLADNVAYLE